MGLKTSHGAFDGTYSSFNDLRRFLLRSIGGSFPPHKEDLLRDDHWYWGENTSYNSTSHKGLLEFFGHSDCEGAIEPEMCAIIANDLEEILPSVKKLELSEPSYGQIKHRGGWVQVTKDFIGGCRLAHERKEQLKFG